MFARLYVNWTYRTLSSNQRTLAAMSVGPARMVERQAAAASSTDTTISRGHIYNTGQIVSIAHDLSHTEMWVIVTREQTGGSTEYDGLQPAYHVTLAKLASVPGGYTVETWLPQT
jgi:riboflavin synthase alpha subunit